MTLSLAQFYEVSKFTPSVAYEAIKATEHLLILKKLRELGGTRVPLNNSGLELKLKQAGLCLCLLSAEINEIFLIEISNVL